MRGEHMLAAPQLRHNTRFIPACAGNTLSESGKVISPIGSSPHARGTRGGRRASGNANSVHPRMRGEHSDCRIIKTAQATVHPRMRGEHEALEVMKAWGFTVHPRMRGEHDTYYYRHPSLGRFIPACAGNTESFCASFSSSCGSSPHARGTRRLLCLEPHLVRFIPACAGNTVAVRQ